MACWIRLRGVRRRHQPPAQLAHHFLPGLRIGRNVIGRYGVEGDARRPSPRCCGTWNNAPAARNDRRRARPWPPPGRVPRATGGAGSCTTSGALGYLLSSNNGSDPIVANWDPGPAHGPIGIVRDRGFGAPRISPAPTRRGIAPWGANVPCHGGNADRSGAALAAPAFGSCARAAKVRFTLAGSSWSGSAAKATSCASRHSHRSGRGLNPGPSMRRDAGLRGPH